MWDGCEAFHEDRGEGRRRRRETGKTGWLERISCFTIGRAVACTIGQSRPYPSASEGTLLTESLSLAASVIVPSCINKPHREPIQGVKCSHPFGDFGPARRTLP